MIRLHKYIFLLGLLIPTCTYLSLSLAGVMSWFCVAVAFVVIPAIDLLFDYQSLEYEGENSFYFDALLYIQLPIQIALLYLFLSKVSFSVMPVWELIGLTLSVGINCGVGAINVAHELGHRSKKIEVLFAKCLLISSLYFQFYIDHNKGHHKFVSTPKDPSSAQRNQNLYSFIIKSIYGTLLSAFKIDRKQMSRGLVVEVLLILIIYKTFGQRGAFFFIAAASFGFVLLECVNYIEHYGLERKKLESGRFEKVMPIHSWNSNHLVSRAVLFNLSRHSDHHYKVNKKYQTLQSLEEAPQLPTGYPGMILLSTIPTVWFRIMNRKLPTS